jgi:zinc transport system permease protein
MFALDILILTTTFALFKEFNALTFDEEYAEISGMPVAILNIILFCMIALTVVILIRVVGIILVIALLTIPPAISIQFSPNLKRMMVTSVIFGIVFTISGLLLSGAFNITSGATIIFVCCSAYLLSLLIKPLSGFYRGKK